MSTTKRSATRIVPEAGELVIDSGDTVHPLADLIHQRDDLFACTAAWGRKGSQLVLAPRLEHEVDELTYGPQLRHVAVEKILVDAQVRPPHPARHARVAGP